MILTPEAWIFLNCLRDETLLPIHTIIELYVVSGYKILYFFASLIIKLLN